MTDLDETAQVVSRKRWAAHAVVAFVAAAGAGWAFSSWRASRTLRIRVETIREEDGAFHKRRTFSSGRRWESFGAVTRDGEHFVVLDPPGAFDSAAVRFLKDVTGRGANRIVYEVEALRSPTRSAPGSIDLIIKRAMEGNAGGTPAFATSGNFQLPEGGWDAQFRTTQAEDAEIPLPAKVRLGVFGGSAEVIEFR